MWLLYWMSLQVGEKIVGFVKGKLFSLGLEKHCLCRTGYFMIPVRFIT